MRAPLAALGVALVAACGSGSPAAAPAPTATPTPSATASPTPSPTPSPSASAAPSPAALVTKPAQPPSEMQTRAPVAVRYVFPVRGCRTSYGHSHHDYPATDVFAARGCVVVSPVSGVVDEVTTVDRWSSSTNKGADRGGLSFSVVGADGVRYYGSHLQKVGVRAGQRVTAGQPVGEVGDTGSARGTGTHLHFGLSWPTAKNVWWVRRGEVYPWPYLDAWKVGGQKSPAAAVEAKRRQVGTTPPCPSYC